jgi:serine-type D-Ala-D-Ala carboxypeptidase/endopeptidase (penicillin-binding protein 4)
MGSVRLRPAHLAAAVAAALASAPPAHAIDAQALQQALTREARSAGAFSGAYARDLASGRELVALRPDTPRIPASVEKLYVTASALLRFGPDEPLRTRAASTVPIDEEGTLAGDLLLVGGGDPTLSDAGLRRLVQALRDAGLRRVEGDVIGDDSRFDRRRGGPRTGWAPDSDLGGRLGALVLRRGFQPDPARYAAVRMRSLLSAAKVRVTGRARSGRIAAAAGETLTDLAILEGPLIGDLIRQTNVPSDNFLADMLLKGLGAEFGAAGTTTAGAAVVRGTLDDFGVRPRIADGSGLSRANRTTPRQVVRLLERMEGQEVAPTWRRSLAVTGRDGTVSRRMRRTAAAGRCRVKTGTIRGVSNLAGVCSTTGGESVAFAWLMNGVNPYGARRIQDRMTALVARYDAG